MIKVKNIDDVVQYQLCTGCGVCASAEPERYRMTDIAVTHSDATLTDGNRVRENRYRSHYGK